MKKTKILSALMMILLAVFMIQCEKQNGRPDGAGAGDPDSDRPDHAGGGDVENPSKNPSPGISRGGDYGDLYVLFRDLDGMPIMGQFLVEDELVWLVQPVDQYGESIGYNTEGELNDPSLAIPVDFGRLNTVRQPASKLEQAFVEAMKVLGGEPVTGRVIHGITLDFCGRLTSEYSDNGGEHIFKTIDAPRENMAIYKEIMQNLFTGRLAFLATTFSEPTDPLTIAASCFAAGSDKTGTINIDEVVYINTFMECDGLVPIPNEHEYDSEGEVRTYFDFSTCCDGAEFTYNRNMYGSRWIKIVILNADGTWFSEEVTVWQAMEDRGLFSFKYGEDDPDLTAVEGFAAAADDAVQVLEFIHGDSNIEFLPNYDPNNP